MSDLTPGPRAPQQPGSVPPPPPPPPLTSAQYGVPGYGVGPGWSPYPAGPADAPNGLASLILGVLGLSGIPLCSPIAMFVAYSGRKQVRQAPPGTYRTGMLTAGWVMGIIGTVLWAIVILSIVLAVIVAVGLSDPESGAVVPFL